jgi:polysaccharide export outer membrane protein
MRFRPGFSYGWRVLLALGVAGIVGACSAAGPITDTSATATATSDRAQPVASPAPPAGGDPDLQLVAELPAPSASQGGLEDVVVVGDVLQVEVFGIDRLNRTTRVDSAGRLSLPLIGDVRAAGKTVRALEREIEARYGRDYLQAPSVSIQLKESAARRVTVEGEVGKPGSFPVATNTTLLQSLAEAGGFRKIADPSKVYVYRQVDNKKYVANYDVDAIRSGSRSDPKIYQGDIVVVFSSSSRVAWENLKDNLGVARLGAGFAVP